MRPLNLDEPSGGKGGEKSTGAGRRRRASVSTGKAADKQKSLAAALQQQSDDGESSGGGRPARQSLAQSVSMPAALSGNGGTPEKRKRGRPRRADSFAGPAASSAITR